MDDWKEVIENLKYLISEDCTDTQFDYADEIEIAIRIMESQEDLWSKINKAIDEIIEKSFISDIYNDRTDDEIIKLDDVLEILKRNIRE